MSTAVTTSVVVAVQGAERNVGAILSALKPGLRPNVEVIFCVAGEVPDVLRQQTLGAKVLQAPASALVPHLWRDGIRAASARRAAITTAHCIPAAGWLERIEAADVEQWAGIGGGFVNDVNASALNWAVFLLRYLRFMPPLPRGPVAEIAADNAVYDRDAILEHQDLLEEGFWEPSFHARFRDAGRKLTFDSAMIVSHAGTHSGSEFMRLRFAHGTEFGNSRGRESTRARRFAMLSASPALPFLLLFRIAKGVVQRPQLAKPFFRALPWLSLFILAWSAGESRGYANAAVKSS